MINSFGFKNLVWMSYPIYVVYGHQDAEIEIVYYDRFNIAFLQNLAESWASSKNLSFSIGIVKAEH